MNKSQIETTPRIDPLARPDIVRIALSERATAALLAQGEAFAIVGRGSYPTDTNRMVIFCQPCPMELATAACQILARTHKAVRIKPPAVAAVTPSAPLPPANMPDLRPDATGANSGAVPAIAGQCPAQPSLTP